MGNRFLQAVPFLHNEKKGDNGVRNWHDGVFFGLHFDIHANAADQHLGRDVTGNIKLPEGVEMVMPGDNIDMEITLITPIACEEGLRFAIREGGRTVGSGVVTKILE